MTFTLLDVIIILAVFTFVIVGWISGFIQALGTLVGTIAGIYIASRAAVPVGEWIQDVSGIEVVPTIVASILVFLLVSHLIGFAFRLLEKAFHLLTILPFISTINRLLGGVFGFLEGLVAVAAVSYFAKQVFPDAWVADMINSSSVATYLLGLFTIFVGLLPETIRSKVPSV